jgi:cold shock protein
LQFDQGRRYGFVAADDGGEDVFLHASVFDGEPGGLVPGMKAEVQVMAGDRGRKASAVRLAEILLHTTPALTGQQILEVRQGVLEFARKRGWVDV